MGSLAAREARSAAFCSSARSSRTSSRQNTALLFSYWCLFNLNPVAQGVCVCVWICVCFNTRHRLKTHLREKAGEAAPDREAVSSGGGSSLGAQSPGSAGFSRCKVGWSSGSRAPGQLMRSETHPDSAGAFSVAVKTNSGPCFPPPSPSHTLYVSG